MKNKMLILIILVIIIGIILAIVVLKDNEVVINDEIIGTQPLGYCKT